MARIDPEKLDVFLLEQAVWIAHAPVGVPNYDFPFGNIFACRRPYERPTPLTAVGRFGVTDDYADLYHQLAGCGIELIHTPDQYRLATELPYWYPLIEDLTPRSVWFEKLPPVDEIEGKFSWPVFLKGGRQTSKHAAALSILQSPEDYGRASEAYRRDPVLHWQTAVCREFVPLRPAPSQGRTCAAEALHMAASLPENIPPSFEFRTFWWRGQFVGAGHYWAAVTSYTWTPAEERAALAMAEETARRLKVTFLVVDVAQTQAGDWIVIEVNDGQESGYAGVNATALWQRVVDLERSRRAH